ncbi:MAG TPA: MarR family transcriptional regulator [Gaiellaceae bacterium]|nr:MarR family transcriptional regulator [Gaiellaceae bacterium]
MATGRPVPSILFELHSANGAVAALLTRRMIAEGIDPNLLYVLWLIDRHAPVTPTELAVEGGYPPTTARDFVNTLVGRGLAHRIENKADRRSHLLESTEQGRRHLEAAAPILRGVERDLDKALGKPLSSWRARLRDLRRAARKLDAAGN